VNRRGLPPKAEQGWWYQYYFATERGRAGYEANRRGIANLIWKSNSPTWGFDTDGTAYAARFSGRRMHRIIKGVGHNLPQEAPQAFAEAVVEVDGY
jgi:pimeloyl-ACP methyl ester carboxylesterase